MIGWLLHVLQLRDFFGEWVSGLLGAIVFYCLALASGRMRDLYLRYRYPIAGRYLTHYEDLVDGQKLIKAAPARLKQRGLAIWGDTAFSPDKQWLLEGRLKTGGYFYGIYNALSPHDTSVGNFFLKINHDGDMDGIWSGYDNYNRLVVAGKYSFRRMDKTVIGPLTAPHEASVLDLASRVLGNDYVPATVAALESNGKEGTLFEVALSSTKLVVGFVLGKLLQPNDLNTVLKGFQVNIPADIAHADLSGRLGIIQTVGVEPKYQIRGIGTRLIQSAMNGLHKYGAETVICVAWKAPDGIHAHSVLTSMSFVPFATINEFWLSESQKLGYSCQACGNPCTCAAVLYKCSHLI